ncbi:MAG TPA: RNA 3'-terminal phosphate cyclase [Candidatus Deferrimicrobium sp.]|nr:RNA 3'-terminal phosphate cyclase [Candidatus Deferrimicrobium sp.]
MEYIIHIDGSFGEGGGQILRTSLALSLVTGKPFHITNIRAGRGKPGLMRQHLTAVEAAARVGAADVEGNSLGSPELTFRPQAVVAGQYSFAVGTAGSCTLVLQTILPALLTASEPSHIILEGGTHNPMAPPFDFLIGTYLPIVNRMGPRVAAVLERPGFFPAGGGRMTVEIEPAGALSPITLLERGPVQKQSARAMVARLPRTIAERELEVIRETLALDRNALQVEEVSDSKGPGNVILVEVASRYVTETFTGFGERGVPAEQIAQKTAQAVREYLKAEVPVGRYLADQLLVPLALAGGGSFRTLSPTDHTTTNVEVIKRFLDVDVSVDMTDDRTCTISLERR